MPRRGQKLTETQRARVSRGVLRGLELKRMRELVRPADLERLRRSGVVAPSIQPLLAVAEREAGQVLEELGGADRVTAQVRALVSDFAWLGLVMRALLWLFAEKPDPETGSRLATLAGARRASLLALGLNAVRTELSLEEYLAQRAQEAAQERSQRANGSPPDHAPGPAADRAPAAPESEDAQP